MDIGIDRQLRMDLENDNVSETMSVYMNGDVDPTSATGHMREIGVISVDQRVKRKAKRLLKQHSKESATDESVVHTRHWKNSRKPRNGYKRGLPKKGRYHDFFEGHCVIAPAMIWT